MTVILFEIATLQSRDIFAIEQNLASGHRDQFEDHFADSTLTTATFTDQGYDLSVSNIEISIRDSTKLFTAKRAGMINL